MKIIVGGQIDKQLVADIIAKNAGKNATISIQGDLDAAMTVKNGQADYYFGACNTGGGGALAMAIAILGMDKCVTVSMPSKVLTEDEIISHVQGGKIAFGFTPQHAEMVIPIIIRELLRVQS